MKAIKFIFAIAIVALTTTSCVEKSEKYKALEAQRDSLLIVGQNYDKTLDLLNDVEAGFQSIRDVEGQIKVNIGNGEVKSKEQFADQINQIKQVLEQNNNRITELQSQLAQSNKNNRSLVATIERLKAELTEKVNFIQSLQEELAKKNIKIDELSTAIEGLNTNITNLNEKSANQQATIATQDSDLNRVWYIVADGKKLKELQILSGNGLFKAKTVMDKEFDKTNMTEVDLRKLNSIPTNSKKPKILSSHSKESYKLVTGDDKMVTIEIVDPGKFWSVSKYLIVQQ